MNDAPEPAGHAPRDSSAPDDEELFGVLDGYLESLHRRDSAESSRLSNRYLDHAALLKCLEGLDRLAGPARSDDGFAPNAETCAFDDAGSATERREQTVDRRFGKFELLEEIGRGGMGVVYRARQADLDRIVAVKMILSNRLASEEDVARFRGEARAAAGLRHANVIGIHEVGEVDGQQFFTMDYVDGPSLARVLADGPVDGETAARWVAKLARAVQYLHDHDVVHRDLKPSNVILDADREPHVTDFGLAKIFSADSQETRSGTILGTASYMSPEQASGRRDRIGPRTDVYGLGAILYELLTGRPPFREAHPLDTLVQVLEGEPTLPSRARRGVPRSLEVICLKCLEKEPDARYATAGELAEDLEHFLRDEPVEARRGGPVQRLKRWARRQPALAARLAGIGLATAVVQGRFLVVGGDLAYHANVTSVLAVWIAAAVLFQWLVSTDRCPVAGPYGWVVSDALLLTAVLFIADGPVGPLVVGYPLLIAAAGMFFRTRYVVVSTLLSLAGYLLFAIGQADYGEHAHYAIIFAAALGVFGYVVGYQVHRVRALSRYYGDRLV